MVHNAKNHKNNQPPFPQKRIANIIACLEFPIHVSTLETFCNLMRAQRQGSA